VADAPKKRLADAREPERRAGRWLALAIAVLAAGISSRGRLEPRTAPVATDDPLLLGQKLDPNTASEAELAAVPGLGAKRAAAVVRAREQEPFWSIRDLDRVSGVGASSLPGLAVWLDPGFTGPPPRIDLNHATARELDRLPGIGPSLAERIVADRAARGPFRRAADLDRVRGIGPARVQALAGRVVPP
jgi:competence ComEA-like helix-hairpin-helix protein